MVRVARIAYAVLAWAFLVGLTVQVFAIGMAMFGEPGFVDVHVGLGWILHLVPLLILLAAFLARGGRRHWLWALALAAVVFVVPIFATLRDVTVIAALHPVSAVLSAVLAVVVAMNSLALLRSPEPASI